MSGAEERAEKVMKCLGIEGGSLFGYQLPSPQAYCSKEANLLASGSREHPRLLAFGSPGTSETCSSLKMDFVLCPNLDTGLFYPSLEFFLNVSCSFGSALAACRRGRCNVRLRRWKMF